MRTKMLRALVAVSLIAATGVVFSPPAGAALKTKTFTNNAGISIPDGGDATPFPSGILVSGFRKGTILDVNVKLEPFGHGFAQDVDILLVSPKGRQVMLLSDVGGGSNTSANLVLDDSATQNLPSSLIASGTYKPTDLQPAMEITTAPIPVPKLSVLNGTSPNGQWLLYVTDDAGCCPDGGAIGSWSLRIKARVS